MNQQVQGAVDLAAPPSGTTAYHKVEVTFDVKQDSQPFLKMVVTYEHAMDAIVAAITGGSVEMAGFLGQKGKKAKDGNFGITLNQTVDGTVVATGAWDGLSRGNALAFERHVLNVWQHMNDQSAVANKALGKIGD